MTKFYKIGLALLLITLTSCVEKTSYEYQEQVFADEYIYEPCQQETTVMVYDDAGAYQVPGCIMDVPYIYETETTDKTILKTENSTASEEDEEINPDDIEGEFPNVVDNKYHKKQVVMQNLQTRVLAYCRGSDDEINECIVRLECAGYTQLRNVPTLPAKYDILKKGAYPSRRWRSGENVPRW